MHSHPYALSCNVLHLLPFSSAWRTLASISSASAVVWLSEVGSANASVGEWWWEVRLSFSVFILASLLSVPPAVSKQNAFLFLLNINCAVLDSGNVIKQQYATVAVSKLLLYFCLKILNLENFCEKKTVHVDHLNKRIYVRSYNCHYIYQASYFLSVICLTVSRIAQNLLHYYRLISLKLGGSVQHGLRRTHYIIWNRSELWGS